MSLKITKRRWQKCLIFLFLIVKRQKCLLFHEIGGGKNMDLSRVDFLGLSQKRGKLLGITHKMVRRRRALLKKIKRICTSLSRIKPHLESKGWALKIGQEKSLVADSRERRLTFFNAEDDHYSDVAPPAAEDCDYMDSNEPKVKLKKLCRQLLRQVPGQTLKLTKLKVLLDQHSSSVLSHFSSEKDALSFLKQKLEGSSKFCVEGKRIRLS